MSGPGSARRAWLLAMPKAELHLHLDGSLRPQTALELADTARVVGPDVPTDLASMRARLVAPPRCRDQADLLRAFELPVALLQDAASLARCARELVEDVAAEGTRYVEIRWAPSLHLAGGLGIDDGIGAVVEGARRGAAATGIEVRLIAVALRTHAPDMAIGVARAAVHFLAEGLTGFDLAGIERDAPDPRRFAEAFELARGGGLGITCHAGEWGGPAQVRGALAIAPWRIAHGAPAAGDPVLDRRARRARRDPRPLPQQQPPGGRRQGRRARSPAPPHPRRRTRDHQHGRPHGERPLARRGAGTLPRLARAHAARARGRGAPGLRGRIPPP